MNVKTIFITGAASGIGLATAKHFLQLGYHVALADLSLAALNEATSTWDSNRFSLYQLDVCHFEQVQAAIADFCDKHDNQLAVLLNSAGILKVGAFESIGNSQHQRTIDVNVKGVINCCQAALPFLKNSSASTVVNMCSASSDYGVPELASYCASKFAVKGLTEALELEWRQYGISVCDLMPPLIATNMLSSQQNSSKVMTRLGNKLAVNDVVLVIEKQVRKPKIHRAVGFQYGLLHLFSSIAPAFVNRIVMKALFR